MFKLSMKCLNFAFKNRCISNSHSFDCRYSLLQNVKCVSFINFTKYSTQSDNEPKSSEIIRIYDAPLTKRIRLTKIFSFSTSIAGFALFPKLINRLEEFPDKLGYYLTIYSVISIFTVGTPILLHWISRKYILFIDYDPAKDNYTLYTYSFLLRLKPLTFNAEDVALITDPLASVSVRGSSFLMEPSNFSDLSHYKRMVGYDKEYDFSLENSESISAGPELKRPEIPNLEETVHAQPEQKRPETASVRQIPKVVDSEKAPSDDDISLPLNLRKKKKR